jgi:hypothetical protein
MSWRTAYKSRENSAQVVQIGLLGLHVRSGSGNKSFVLYNSKLVTAVQPLPAVDGVVFRNPDRLDPDGRLERHRNTQLRFG